jgi:bis(5'-nucleosyl)-tetraphosphatase (symmetrical)
MATYAIGDIQGNYSALRRLLDQCRFEPKRDKLWLVGDLVNRGPHSLAVLRFVKGLGARAVTVLGNHDLNLLTVATGQRKPASTDTFDAILKASDRDELIDWLRRRKLMHVEGEHAMVHAGLLPQWTIKQALKLAHEVEAELRGEDYEDFLAHMYGSKPDHWRDSLSGMKRLRVIVNAMTRMRICTAAGRMEFSHKGKPFHLPAGFMPWFAVPHRKSQGTTILCGHWSALGLFANTDVIAIDTGCLWGGELTALRLEDRRLFQHACALPPGSKRWR